MSDRSETGNKGLSIILTLVFILAMVMGPGPGVYLINPGPEHEGPAPTLIGLPIVYAWAVLWFGVQAVVLVTAYFTVWADQEEEE
ncbi:MAG: hypothetical protein CMJ91_00330 [Planctomycetes bacterium]|nr:hypothetical protein [Planctomycetota bacterium]MBL04688.1 hypothetical protein [Planctomycetota bacterium]|tara:strand:+ start:336 stop:590 length:255 start_codon:yes stop_codon:yes gene_type:complete